MNCAHVHEKLPMSAFWEEVELTPVEVSFPGYGLNIPTNLFNSRWGNGILQQELPEPPLHYLMGTSGSAFAILWNKIEKQTEAGTHLLEYTKQVYEEHFSSTDEDSSGDEGSDVIDSEIVHRKRSSNFASERQSWMEYIEKTFSETNAKEDHETDVLGRGIIIERTAKVHNFATSFRTLQKFLLNTDAVNHETATGRIRKSVNTRKTVMSLCDSGIACNHSAVHAMRPQRTADILIVVDCSPYRKEDCLDLDSFATVQDQLFIHGVKFPHISMKKIVEDPFREVYLFEDRNDKDCPIVIWFTLANGKFRRLENPPRRPGYPTPDPVDEGEVKFNDFTITAEETEFSTTSLSYSPLSFDRLRELMKFNVAENISLLKEKIASKVDQLRNTR